MKHLQQHKETFIEQCYLLIQILDPPLIVTSNCKDALRNEDLRSKCDFQTMRMHQI